MRYFVFFVLIAIVAIWLIRRAHNEKEAEEAGKGESLHDQIHEVTDYTTGKTPINVGIQSQWRIRVVQIRREVSNFEIMNGRTPRSLDELVEEDRIGEQDMYMRYGNVKSKLISGLNQDGQFFIKWIGMDRKEGTNDDRVEVF